MGHDWMIAQLNAMAAYATANDLPALAQALRDARLVALTEIASLGADGRAPNPAPRKPAH